MNCGCSMNEFELIACVHQCMLQNTTIELDLVLKLHVSV